MFIQNPRQILWYNFLNFSKKKKNKLFFQFLFFKKNIYLPKIIENFNIKLFKTINEWKINRNISPTKFLYESGCNCDAQENFYVFHNKRKAKKKQHKRGTTTFPQGNWAPMRVGEKEVDTCAYVSIKNINKSNNK